MPDTFISDGINHERISPATTNLQREIKNELQNANEAGHYNFEVQKLTLGGDGLGRGERLACRDVQITTAGTDVQLTIVDSANSDDDGTVEGWLIPDVSATGAVPIKVDNVGRLRFFGASGAVIYILIRK